jgi:hypothetical protein
MKPAAFPFTWLHGVASRSSNHQIHHRQKIKSRILYKLLSSKENR